MARENLGNFFLVLCGYHDIALQVHQFDSRLWLFCNFITGMAFKLFVNKEIEICQCYCLKHSVNAVH